MADRIYFETHGRCEDPALFLLHGFLGSHADWGPVAQNLESRYFCILPDLPGHGLSPLAAEENSCLFENTAGNLIAIMNELNLGKAVLAGYSLGGRLALFTALGFPGKVEALILEGANPGLSNPKEREERRQKDESWATMLEKSAMPAFLEKWYAQDLFSSMRRHPERLARLKTSRLQNSPTNLARAMRAFSLAKQPSLWELLDLISIPVLLVSGAEDSKFREINDRMASRIHNVKRALIEDAGHNAHFEQGEKFSEALISFLRSTN